MHKCINSYENHVCVKYFFRKMCKHICMVLETWYVFTPIFTAFYLWLLRLQCCYKQIFNILPGKYVPGIHRDPRKHWKTSIKWDCARGRAGLALATHCGDISAADKLDEQKKSSHHERLKIRPKLRSKEAVTDLPLIRSPSRQIDTGRFWHSELCSSHLTFKDTR